MVCKNIKIENAIYDFTLDSINGRKTGNAPIAHVIEYLGAVNTQIEVARKVDASKPAPTNVQWELRVTRLKDSNNETDNGSISLPSNFSHTLTEIGDYTIEVTVWNCLNEDRPARDSILVRVLEPIQDGFNITCVPLGVVKPDGIHYRPRSYVNCTADHGGRGSYTHNFTLYYEHPRRPWKNSARSYVTDDITWYNIFLKKRGVYTLVVVVDNGFNSFTSNITLIVDKLRPCPIRCWFQRKLGAIWEEILDLSSATQKSFSLLEAKLMKLKCRLNCDSSIDSREFKSRRKVNDDDDGTTQDRLDTDWDISQCKGPGKWQIVIVADDTCDSVTDNCETDEYYQSDSETAYIVVISAVGVEKIIAPTVTYVNESYSVTVHMEKKSE